MLTVIIAESNIIEQYDRSKALLAPFDNEETVFCKWNPEAGSIEEMLPDLKDIISFTENWRAVIVTEKNKEELNPFDFVHYSEYINKNGKLGFDQSFIDNCKKMFECITLSTDNPLMRLSTALNEIPRFAEVIESDIDVILSSDEELLQYVFKTQLDETNTRRLVADISKYRLEQLSLFVSTENTAEFLTALSDKNYAVIYDLLPKEKLIPFLEFAKIGSSAIYDPGYWFSLFENTKKAQIYDSLKNAFRLKTVLPHEILCVSLRDYDTHLHNNKVMWSDNSESMYSDFVRYNLYNENIRFLVYDIPYDYINKAAEILKFHMMLQVLALHGNASSSITKNRIFSVSMEYDKRELNRTIAKLIAKLKITAVHINEEIALLKSKEIPEIDNKTARLIFETDVSIPVSTDKEYVTQNLMAEHKIGLSRDCPEEELNYWVGQYVNIRKLFKRFLREPQRAVKKACTVDFKNNNKISDIRAIGLNENQKEDILIKLEEEEQNMVSTVTDSIYNTAKYNEALDEADKNIRLGIKQRMSRKKTVLCGLFAVLAYFVGFLPLIFSNFNTAKSFSFSFLITAVVIFLFACCGFVYLFVLKKHQVERYKNFNRVMSGICSEIRSSLTKFSEYLSHACMVMREKSVLDLAATKETEDTSKIRVLRFNLSKLEREIENNYKILADFSSDDIDTLMSDWEREQVRPFEYDYTRQENFSYSLFDGTESKEIEYMLKGHMVNVPMLCVEKITLKREELYD